MKPKNKKICLLFSGGTTLSEKDIERSSVRKEEDIKEWLEQVPEITIMADIEPVFICGEEQGLKGKVLWQKVSEVIYEKANKADGFVVVVSLESVINLGIALSFALQNLNKAVILTGSQITKDSIKFPDWPEKKKKSYGGLGVKANLINAVQAVNLGLPTKALMFGNRIISPVKARRIQALGLNLFESVDGKYLGKIDFGISLTERFKARESKVELKNQFENNIQIIEYFPGIDINKSINSSKGIIIRNLSDLSEFNIKDNKVPVLVHNPYLISQQNHSGNIIVANKMTWETAVIKFMWALGQGSDPREVMQLEHCNEFINH